MDTREEIAREKWIQSHMYLCCTCKYHKSNYCDNPDGEFTGMEVWSIDSCDDWTEKNWAERIRDERLQTLRTLQATEKRER